MTVFDVLAGLTLLVSTVAGLVRGAARELTTLAALVFAALIAVFALRFTGPLASRSIHPGWLAASAAMLVTFVLVYGGVRLAGERVSRSLRRTSLSGLDRLLGLGLGLARGVVVLGGCTLLLQAATPAERMPAWLTGSRLYPLSAAAADALRAVGPRGLRLMSAMGMGRRPGNAETDDARTPF